MSECHEINRRKFGTAAEEEEPVPIPLRPLLPLTDHLSTDFAKSRRSAAELEEESSIRLCTTGAG